VRRGTGAGVGLGDGLARSLYFWVSLVAPYNS
jgi:hypothetical protein